jgi:hypothetical protein
MIKYQEIYINYIRLTFHNPRIRKNIYNKWKKKNISLNVVFLFKCHRGPESKDTTLKQNTLNQNSTPSHISTV